MPDAWVQVGSTRTACRVDGWHQKALRGGLIRSWQGQDRSPKEVPGVFSLRLKPRRWEPWYESRLEPGLSDACGRAVSQCPYAPEFLRTLIDDFAKAREKASNRRTSLEAAKREGLAGCAGNHCHGIVRNRRRMHEAIEAGERPTALRSFAQLARSLVEAEDRIASIVEPEDGAC